MTLEFGDGADRRKKRIRAIIDRVREAQGCNLRSLVGYAVVNLGLKRTTAKTYIEELIMFGVLYRKGDIIYAKKEV